MGGRLRKSKHGGDSAVEYVSSGNKLIKKKKEGVYVFYDTVDKWMISFSGGMIFFWDFSSWVRVLIFIEIVEIFDDLA